MLAGARPAVEADLGRLVHLADAAAGSVADERGGPVFLAREVGGEPAAPRLRRGLSDPDRAVFAGTLGGRVVGLATAHAEVLDDHTVLGRIDDLFVEEPARGVGVGEALLGVLTEWFRTRRCTGVDASALPGSRETKNFFEAAGFSARLITMHRSLTP